MAPKLTGYRCDPKGALAAVLVDCRKFSSYAHAIRDVLANNIAAKKQWSASYQTKDVASSITAVPRYWAKKPFTTRPHGTFPFRFWALPHFFALGGRVRETCHGED